MGDGNGITAMLAHRARAGDDNIFVRGLIEAYTFLTYGIVEKYEDGRVDVRCGTLHFTNVEVVIIGVNGWGIKPVPDKDDRVLLIGSQAPIPDLKKFEATGSMPAYDVSGLKAIPITDDETAQLFTVDKDGITLEGNNKITINDDGIEIEDANGNKVTTDDKGVAFEDLNGNKVTTDDKGITIEDTNSNKITTKSAGIELEDSNGCKIVTSSSSVKINDKLEIKK